MASVYYRFHCSEIHCISGIIAKLSFTTKVWKQPEVYKKVSFEHCYIYLLFVLACTGADTDLNAAWIGSHSVLT